MITPDICADLGELKQPITPADIRAAATAAHKLGKLFAKLSAGGATVLIGALASEDTSAVTVVLNGPVEITVAPGATCPPIFPIHRDCIAPCPRMRREAFHTHGNA